MTRTERFLCWIGLHAWIPWFDLSTTGKLRVVDRCERCGTKR